MRKPHWKRQGLPRPVKMNGHQQKLERERKERERRIADLPPGLREFARLYPGLVR